MKRLSLTLILMMTTYSLFAFQEGLNLTATYLAPINPPEEEATGDLYMERNFAFGAELGFWGIFTASAAAYTDITWNTDSFMGIENISPIGLFSAGFGMDIPMGPIHFVMDWSQYYNAGQEGGEVFDYSDSFKYGIRAKVNSHIAVEVFSRKLVNFTKAAKENTGLTVDEIEFIGVGLVINTRPFFSNPKEEKEEDDWEDEWKDEWDEEWDKEWEKEKDKDLPQDKDTPPKKASEKKPQPDSWETETSEEEWLEEETQDTSDLDRAKELVQEEQNWD